MQILGWIWLLATTNVEPIAPEVLNAVVMEMNLDAVQEKVVDPIAFDYDPDYFKNRELEEARLAERQGMYYIPGANIEVKGRIHDYDRAPVSTVIQDGNTIYANYPRENVMPQIETPTFLSRERGFYIDQHAVYNSEYQAFLKETKHPAPSHWPKGKMPSGEENSPVVNILYSDAVAYAAWAGKRLPKDSEYERAYRKYPQLRRYAPQKEWTSTVVDPNQLPEKYFLYGGSPSVPNRTDIYTGFRCALDGR